MKRIIVLAGHLIFILWSAVASGEPVTILRNNGDPANRIDMVILGDGYTATELDQYAAAVNTFVNALFAQQPFSEYQRYFNVHRIDVISAESGADHPERNPPVFKATALDATYNCAGIQRLVCVSLAKANSVLMRSIPPASRDVVVVIVNDPEYGGSGGAVAVASVHFEAVEIILHELGHSLGRLADEYGGPPPPACNSDVEPPEANATKENRRERIKWAAWIDPDTRIPTSGMTAGEPGLYEGAKYCDNGLYRPTFNSKMRSLNRPFEQINSEQLIKSFYSFVSPIESHAPSESIIELRGKSQNFRVETPRPLLDGFEIVWRVDGQLVATGNEFTLRSEEVSPGSHRVEVAVTDATPLVRSDPAGVLSDFRAWDVSVIASGEVRAPDLFIVSVSNPPARAVAGMRFTITDTVRNGGAAPARMARTNYYLSLDASGNGRDRRLIGSRRIKGLADGEESTGTTVVHILPNVPTGVYFVIACIDGKGKVTETNEANNCKASVGRVAIEPR